jgi:hypothetical protein
LGDAKVEGPKRDEVPPRKPITIQIGNFDKDEFPKKKTKM